MRKSFRLLLIAAIALGVAPGTWLRTPVPPPDFTAPLVFAEIADAQGLSGEATLLGAWNLETRNAHSGGFSSIEALSSKRLLIGSDRGRLLEISLPQIEQVPPPLFDYFGGTTGGPRIFVDLESIAFDPASRMVWGAYEFGGRIERYRYTSGAGQVSSVMVPEMAGWPDNGGAETMLRLPDGRFVIIAEVSTYKSRAGLLFAGDPIDNPAPKKFRFMPPDGYNPVDGTMLPDGRALILVRRVVWGIPPRFATAIVLADPAEIEEGKMWEGQVIARMGGPDLDENLEGIAAIERDDGSLDLYLVADDNLSAFQTSQMLRLNWKPDDAETDDEADLEAANK